MRMVNRWQIGATFHLTCIVAASIAGLLADSRYVPAADAAAMAARVPWSTSHVSGTPEPPPPYITPRVFPKLHCSHSL